MMDENTALTGTTTTTTTTTTKMLFTFSITLLLGLALYSAGSPIYGGTSHAAAAAGGGGGMTRGVSTAVAKKTTVMPTSMPTLQMFLQQYPEVQDRSSEEQDHLYMVYKLHLSGATSDDLDKLKTTAWNYFLCCKDPSINPYPPKTFSSPGCQSDDSGYCGASPNAPNTECYPAKGGICCSFWPVNHQGRKAWPWDWKCV